MGLTNLMQCFIINHVIMLNMCLKCVHQVYFVDATVIITNLNSALDSLSVNNLRFISVTTNIRVKW